MASDLDTAPGIVSSKRVTELPASRVAASPGQCISVSVGRRRLSVASPSLCQNDAGTYGCKPVVTSVWPNTAPN